MADWSKEKIQKFVSNLKDLHTHEKLGQFYDDFAPQYDKAVKSFGYVGPSIAVKLLNKYVKSKDAWILDVAAGTGLVGEYLVDSGYTNIDAVDGSVASTEVARKKNIYKHLYVQWLGGDNKLNTNNEGYDALVCVGGFALNQLKSDVFPEFIRVVKPGGFIVINIRTNWLDREASYSDGKFERDMAQMETNRKWKLIEKYLDIQQEESVNQDSVTFIHQVC
ncbi:methyltransferase-like protein 27 [Antedon mediterranea]|uniref:methyltransferase-like protein 27 n=1 Tax=Antedon mediterranea TaxID=105859 RepID=UPI003AF4A819